MADEADVHPTVAKVWLKDKRLAKGALVTVNRDYWRIQKKQEIESGEMGIVLWAVTWETIEARSRDPHELFGAKICALGKTKVISSINLIKSLGCPAFNPGNISLLVRINEP